MGLLDKIGSLSADALLGGATGIVGNVLGVLGQNQANKMNAQIARETNALNYSMFQEAKSWQKYMWDKENQYNLPVNQRQRLLEAGVNPAALVDAPQLGAASSPSGYPSPSAAQGYQYQNIFGNLNNDFVATTQAMKNIAEAKNIDTQTANYEWSLTEQIDLWKKQGLLTQKQAEEIEQNMDLKTATWNDLMQQIRANAYMTQKQADILNMQHELLTTYGHVEHEANLEKICTEVYHLINDAKYKDAQTLLGKLGLNIEQQKVSIDRFRAMFEHDESRSRTAVNWQTAEGQKLQNDINKEFGRGSAAAKFLIDYYSGKIAEPKVLKAEWEKLYREIPPGQIGAIMRYLIDDINPLNGLLK